MATPVNNLIHDVCWNGSLRYPAISMRQGDQPSNPWTPTIVIVKGNTVYNAGSAGIGFRGQVYGSNTIMRITPV